MFWLINTANTREFQSKEMNWSVQNDIGLSHLLFVGGFGLICFSFLKQSYLKLCNLC